MTKVLRYFTLLCKAQYDKDFVGMTNNKLIWQNSSVWQKIRHCEPFFWKTAWQSINLALSLPFGLPRSLCSLAMTAGVFERFFGALAGEIWNFLGFWFWGFLGFLGSGFYRNFGDICHFERSEKSTEFKIRLKLRWKSTLWNVNLHFKFVDTSLSCESSVWQTKNCGGFGGFGGFAGIFVFDEQK